MSNRTVIAQLCVIGALLPLWLILSQLVSGDSASDFLIFWQAARATLLNEPVYSSTFAYPPHSLFLFAPLGALTPDLAALLFNAAGFALFAFAAKPYLPRGFPAFAILSPATLLCLYYGQTGLIVGGLWLLAFRGNWPAVALLTFKPHLGLLSALSLRTGKRLPQTGLVVAALVAASIGIFGLSLWQDFLSALLGQAEAIGQNTKWPVSGVSPAIGYGVWGWVPFAVAAALLLARRVTPFTAATAALLISPYGFHYDMPVACLGLSIAIYDCWRSASVPDRIALCGGYLAPVLVYFGTWWIPPLLLWALWVQTRRRLAGTGETASRGSEPNP